MASPKNQAAENTIRRFITCKFRVSYAHVFEAQAPKPTDKRKFSLTMLVPKDEDMTGMTLGGEPVTFKTAIKNAKIAKFGPKENWPDNLQSPVGDGDDPKYAGKEGYAGHWIIKASTGEHQRPGVVDENAVPITDQSKFYSGCYACAYVYAYVWEYMGKQGVGFILDHVQKLADGPAFGGKKQVEQVFKPVGKSAVRADDLDADEDDSF